VSTHFTFIFIVISYKPKIQLLKHNSYIRLTSTAASIASASVPSAALVLMLIVLTAIDAPCQDVSLLWAIDWFV
jgi:Na+/H+-dicarboxylate symporter